MEKFLPKNNKVYFINTYTLIHILEGSGSIEVDFKKYYNWQEKAIYLEKGQYIKFLSDDFKVRKIEFKSEALFRNKEIRVLFKHLISVGYIDFKTCEDCKKFLNDTVFSENTSKIIDVSSKQWYWQNPFNATKSEYQIIFDIKDVIDKEFSNHLTNKELTNLINSQGAIAQTLVKDKIGISVKSLLSKKRLVESKKAIAFTEKSIKEVSYELGYTDPAYFQRVFKQVTGSSPGQFRSNFDYDNRDTFTQNILELLRQHHRDERNLAFYADKMNLSIKALSKKTRDKFNISLGQLIRQEIIQTAKQHLKQQASITETAYSLGFEEPNHFSSFFKHYAGISPRDFQAKKYNY